MHILGVTKTWNLEKYENPKKQWFDQKCMLFSRHARGGFCFSPMEKCTCVSDNSRSDCHSPIVNSKKISDKTTLHYLICVAATNRPELEFIFASKTSVGTSDVVGYFEMTKNPTMKTLKLTMSMKTTMATAQRRVLKTVWLFCHFHNTECVYSGCSLVFAVSLPHPL